MARHSIKEIEDKAIELLGTPDALDYLVEPVKSYENELIDLAESGEVISGPRIWTIYEGSAFPRGEADSAYVYNEDFGLAVLCYDDNYAGSEVAAAGELIDPKHVGTRQMIEDVKTRLMGVKTFFDCMPFILAEVRRVDLPVRTASLYRVLFRTEFDYGGPQT